VALTPSFPKWQFIFGIGAGFINFLFCMENKFMADARSPPQTHTRPY